MSKITKSKNLDIYRYLMPHRNSDDVPIDAIAKKFGFHKNKVIGYMSSAKKNSTIYLALIAQGFTDEQTPPWFARPGCEARTRSVTTQKEPPHSPAPAQYDELKSSPFIATNQPHTPAPSQKTAVIRPTTIEYAPVYRPPSTSEIMVKKFAEQMEQQMIKEYYEDQLLRQQEREAWNRKLKESEKTPAQRALETLNSPQFIEATLNLSDDNFNFLVQNILKDVYPPGYLENQALMKGMMWSMLNRR